MIYHIIVMAFIEFKTWFLSIDFRFQRDKDYKERLKTVKDFLKEKKFVESDTTSSLFCYTEDKFRENQIKRELLDILRGEDDPHYSDIVILRSIRRTKYIGKRRLRMRHSIWILDIDSDKWKSISEHGLYNKFRQNNYSS